MKNLLHTPEGVRDIYNIECGKKLLLESRLHKILQLYGYHDIQTPTFEYFDVFRKEIGTTPSKELYKFFDRDGNTLVLRPDMTPSIARAAATLFAAEELPIRLCYTGSTFINHSSYQGRLKENTQMGAEFIGVDSVEADAEMLAVIVDCLTTIGLRDFQLNVGNVDFFECLLEDAALSEEAIERVRELINNRNYFGLEEYLESIQVRRSAKEAFVALGELYGGAEVLAQAKNIAPNSKAIMAVRRLELIYEVLKVYGVEQYVNFDFSMSGIYGYYTGIIFRGYTFGTGDAIVKGGRYDYLLEKFGKNSPSIGFVLIIDELMNALSRQNVRIPYSRKNTVILYDEGKETDAIKLAKEFREKCKNTELVKRCQEKGLDVYITYGKEYYAGSLVYIQENDQILMLNLLTGEKKIINRKEQKCSDNI